MDDGWWEFIEKEGQQARIFHVVVDSSGRYCIKSGLVNINTDDYIQKYLRICVHRLNSIHIYFLALSAKRASKQRGCSGNKHSDLALQIYSKIKGIRILGEMANSKPGGRGRKSTMVQYSQRDIGVNRKISEWPTV